MLTYLLAGYESGAIFHTKAWGYWGGGSFTSLEIYIWPTTRRKGSAVGKVVVP